MREEFVSGWRPDLKSVLIQFTKLNTLSLSLSLCLSLSLSLALSTTEWLGWIEDEGLDLKDACTFSPVTCQHHNK